MVHSHDFIHRMRRNSIVQAAQDLAQDLVAKGADVVSHGADTLQQLSGQSSNKNDAQQGVSTVVSVVYVTMPATFSGPTAGFVTQTQGVKTTTTVETKPTTTSTKQTTKATTDSQTTTTAAASVAVGNPVQATREATTSSATSTPTSSAQASTSQSGQTGMSGGAKAGIALVVIALLALAAGAAIFFMKKKKRQQRQHVESHNLDNEKDMDTFMSSSNANSRAPRLSLRPVTQFLPSLGEPKVAEMTSATGGLSSFPMPAPPQQRSSGWERRPGSNLSADISNPFGHTAERLDPAAAEKAAENAPIPVAMPSSPSPPPAHSPTSDPFADKPESRAVSPEEPRPVTAQSQTPTTEIATAAAAIAVGGAAVSQQQTSPKSQQNNVHRVQLDFKPSMEDELELRAGQLVRILHEYDDGWALCVYMDRSKQGVAPRTCLSKMALKPRPNGPPPGMAPLRPQSPGMRNFSGPPSAGLRDPLYPAPLSPSMPNMNVSSGMPQNSNSPPGGRQRSYSQSQPGVALKDHRRSASMSQLGLNGSARAAIPNRKPVPGQAM
ncbi:hypothetical protein K461DRAFT_10090 [Myriangium duriaei CBS 260.36]|uniref:SH3 domain-containing protein n=1 Tax=Myriangium duriaei CBS 260.36 TaxID=1168546 RepID=A0A9P4MJE5_9PEZI|nr:hypothetical protein K461DRAFT_10090 [Myriangium duriaei CBS 260.36]